MSIFVFAACLSIVRRRMKQGITIAVPLVLGAIALVASIRLAITVLPSLISCWHAISEVTNQADKATILAAGISEAIRAFVSNFVMSLFVPLCAWLVDRWLQKREQLARSVVIPGP